MRGIFGDHTSRIFMLGALLLALAFAFFAVNILLVPFVAALFAVYLFEPGVTRLQRHSFSPGNAFILILLLSIVGVVTTFAFIPSWVSLDSFGGSDTAFTERLEQQLTDLETWAKERMPFLASFDIAGSVTDRGTDAAITFFNNLPSLIGSVSINLLLVPFIAYFIVRDGKRLKRRIVEQIPNRYFETSLMVLHQIDLQVGGYFRGRLIESVLVGVAMAVAMGVVSIWITVPYILLMGAVIGITNLIPYVGPVMGLAFGSLLYLGQGLPVSSILGLAIAVAIAQLLDNLVFAPVVLSHNVDLHPLTVVLVLIIGGEILGVMGLLIAVPVAASLKIITGEVYRNYRLQVR